MRSNADRKSRRALLQAETWLPSVPICDRRLAIQRLIGPGLAIAFALLMGTIVFGGEANERSKSRETTAGIRLPPRSTPASEDSNRGKSTSSRGLWTTTVSLAAVLGCLGLVGYWLKPYWGVPGGLPVEALELLGRRVIEPKVAIHLVRCGGKVLVVGVSPDGARTLSEIVDPAEVQRLVSVCRAPRETGPLAALVPGANGLIATWTGGATDSASLPPRTGRAGTSLPPEEPRRA